jgi:hypothetical protein
MRPVFVKLTATTYGTDPNEGVVILNAHRIDSVSRKGKVTTVFLERQGGYFHVVETPEQVQALIDKAFRTKR